MKSWTILLSTLCLFSCNQQENKFEKYVDPLIGTDIRIVQGKDKNSTEERGQIMPAVGVPHGMTNWVAQTQATEQKCHPPTIISGCNPRIPGQPLDERLLYTRLRQRHNYAAQQQARNRPGQTRLHFHHTQETATPSYYSVDLNDYDIHAN